MIPSMIKELLLSPGCTLDVNTTEGHSAISSGALKKLVIMSISQSLPAIDLQRGALLTLSLLEVVQTLLRWSYKSVKVYG
jgi:hypothetical protein